jgi:hypothetical protein
MKTSAFGHSLSALSPPRPAAAGEKVLFGYLMGRDLSYSPLKEGEPVTPSRANDEVSSVRARAAHEARASMGQRLMMTEVDAENAPSS